MYHTIQMQLFGHILRLSKSTPAQRVMTIYFNAASDKKDKTQRKEKIKKAYNLLPQLLHKDLRSSFLNAPLQKYEDLKTLRTYAKDRKQWQLLVADIFTKAKDEILATLQTLLGKRKKNSQIPEAAETPHTLESSTNQEEEPFDDENDSDTYITEPNKKRRKLKLTNKHKRVRTELHQSNKRSRIQPSRPEAESEEQMEIG